MMDTLSTRILAFEQLSIYELYEILRLRASIFIVEQECVYQDLDAKDLNSQHILGYYGGRFVAYSRIIAPDEKGVIHIGRVLVDKQYRGRQLARQIMKKSLDFCQVMYPEHPVELAAQSYLSTFYESLGFKKISDEYIMDGIPHLDMRWKI